MTVSTELSHEEYTGNGVTTDFDFRFRIFEAKHLVVSVADPDGTERILTNGTDYTLRGVGSYRGGKVILKMPLATGWKIGIARDLPVVQETDLRNQGKFFAEVHEDAFDYLTMLIQKSLGYLSLCLRKPSFISDHYDAKGNKISNLGKPVKDGDAVDLGTMKEHINTKDKRSLRVADKDIPALPSAVNRANKLMSFDDGGNPVVIVPESGSAADVLAELGKPDGYKLIPSLTERDKLNFKKEGDLRGWGVVIDGSQDMTNVINNAILEIKSIADSEGVPPVVKFPAGLITTSGMIEIFDWGNGTVFFDGTFISGIAQNEYESLFLINNASNLKVHGSVTLQCNGLKTYKAGFKIKASPGGLIKPDTGIVSHVSVHGVAVRQALIGFDIGDKTDDAQVAELNFIGCETMFCPTGVKVGGSQTGATFSACNITSGYWPTFSGEKFRVLDISGGLMSFLGGEFINSGVPLNELNSVAIEVTPSLSNSYLNPYPVISFAGVHIETNSALIDINNGGILSEKLSNISSISFSSCKGYLDATRIGSLINIYEDSYQGKIKIEDSCGFYINNSITSLVTPFKSESKYAVFSCGETSLGVGFKNYVGGSVGGIVKHKETPIIIASSPVQSWVAGLFSVSGFSLDGKGAASRYSKYMDISTGAFTVPSGGFDKITVSAHLYSEGLDGDIFLSVNGFHEKFGRISGGTADLDAVIGNVREGDIIQIIIRAKAGGSFIKNTNNKITLFAST